jgi:hypothetical protein
MLQAVKRILKGILVAGWLDAGKSLATCTLAIVQEGLECMKL